MRRRRPSCRPQLVTEETRALEGAREREKELFLFIRTAVPYAAAAAGRDCNRNIVAYAREAIGGERKRNIPSTAKPVYNFISRRPGAPRRDRRHAHLCVSWAPAQVASPFAASQRLMLLPLLPLLSLESLCLVLLLRRPVPRERYISDVHDISIQNRTYSSQRNSWL